MSQGDSSRGEVFVVDDEPAVCDALAKVFSRAGYNVATFADGAALLAAVRGRSPTCIILDVHIPGQSGLDILAEMNAQNYPAPIFIMSGKGDIPMAVKAIKHGAFDFIEKPFRGSDLLARVRQAIEAHGRWAIEDTSAADPFHFPGRQALTRREQHVLTEIVAGATNKEAARRLGISPRTIEVHRANIMMKLGARNTADLTRIALGAQRGNG
jgi:FixJ family two-component response regulator